MYKHCPIIVGISGFAILVTGIVCTWYGFPKLVEWQIKQNTIMREGSQSFKVWKKQPFPLHFKVYLFNVSNTAEVMNGATPVLKEIGPYVYDLHIERQILEIDEETDTIKYYMKKTYYFNANASDCRSEDDMVTIINAALMGTILKVYSIIPSLLHLVKESYPYIYPEASDMFIRSSVKDLLFRGITLHCTAPEIETICMAMKAALPSTMKLADNEKDFIFSMFGAFNGTRFGPFTMTRGIKNTTRGALIEYKEQSELDVWGDNGVCNMLNGSDSGLYFTMKKPVDKIYTFTPEICRSIGISFEKKMNSHAIPVFKYSATAKSLSHKGANRCFCDEADLNEYECPQDGLLNLEPCLKAPVLMSNPHFYLGDKTLLDYATGLEPRKELHESYLMIEPNTATPIEGAKRTQMNIEVKKFEDFPLSENMSEGVFPILWLEEGVVLPDDLLDFLQGSFKKIATLDIMKWTLIACGIVLMLVSFVLVMYQEKLMCFSSSGKVTVSDVKNVGVFNTTSSGLSFNTTVPYPQAENPAYTDTLGRNNQPEKTDAWPFKP